MEKDSKGRALYYSDFWGGYYIKVKGYSYMVVPTNKYQSYSGYRVVIRENSGTIGCTIYISNKHSNLTFEDAALAWNFIDNEILNGKFDYYKDIENYNKQQLEEKYRREKEKHNINVERAKKLKNELEKYNMNINQLVELIKLYDNVDYDYLVEYCGYSEGE